MSKIVVIGSLNMDLVAVVPRLPVEGETIIGTRYLNEPGGKGANQAYAAARLGGDVAMLGRIGADDHGERMRANLAAVRCDVGGVRMIEGSSGIAMIWVSASGQNSIVVVPGANFRYSAADVPADGARLSGAEFLLLQLEIPIETVIAAARAGKQHGARVILDPAPAPAPNELPTELFQCVDILTPNETEAAQLVGHRPASLSAEEAGGLGRQLQARGTKTVIIKLGSRGCLLFDGEATEMIAAPIVETLDTTAAGDVFNGAVAVACSEGASLGDACRFAVRAAAVSVTRLGAQRSMPSRGEVDSFLEYS